MNNKNLPQNWDFFMCRIEGAPASIRTNLALIEVAPLEGLSQRLQFYIKMQNPRPDGLSSNEECPITIFFSIVCFNSILFTILGCFR